MTARVTTLKGLDAGRYYVEALPSYYLDSGEPPGRWHGNAADALGLSGDVDDDAFLRLMAGDHPLTGRRLGTRLCERSARGFDVTCSAPKSVSVLFALGDDTTRGEVLAAHDTAVTAMVDWVEAHAHTRYRVHGQVGVYDTDGIVAALFRQHTSRALDPQLHTHVVIPNRVLSHDGRWLALDARTIKHDQRTLSALYHAALRTEMTARLGVRWREPANGIAEIANVPQDLLAAFSTRSNEVDARLDEKLDRFVDTYGRQPTARERWRLEREAVVDSRPAKTSVDASTLRDGWAARAADITPEWEGTITAALDRVQQARLVDETQLTRDALTALAEKQSAWRPAELVRELAGALPPDSGLRADDIWPLLNGLTERLIIERCLDLSPPVPDGVPVRRDGRPVTESAIDRVVTVPAIVVEEERVLALAEQWVTHGGDHPGLVTGDQDRLSGDQLDVARAVAGDRRLVLVVGPAGAGKTTALRPAIAQLRRDGRVVFGVAPSATAAEVLAVETGVVADTVDKLLTEHHLARPPHPRYDLPAGSTMLVDEAAMVSNPKLAALFTLAEARDWRLALAGDPLQFSAVGRSGLFGYLADALDALELGRVHRFTEVWEANASLRLRRGDLSVVDVYDQHGRLHGGTATRMRTHILDTWWHATRCGETVAMVAPTNEQVIALNQHAQRLRLDAGELASGRTVEAGAYTIHVGDVVATRQNDRRLRTDRNQMVKNRDRWTVTALTGTGVTVSGATGTVTLPAPYVRDHLELAYAETSHASQGRTVDRSLLLLDGATNTAGIYVPMTRGRRSNEAYVVIRGEQTAADVVAESLARTWIDPPAIERRAELAMHTVERPSRPPDRMLPPRVLRQALERAHEIDQTIARRRFDLDTARRELDRIQHHRQAALRRTIDDYQTRIDAAERVIAEHDRPLHRHRHRYDIDGARAQLSWTPGALEEAQRELAELEAAAGPARERLAAAVVGAAGVERLRDERIGIAARLDSDRRARAVVIAAEPDHWIVDRVGPPPTAGRTREAWEHAAGLLDQHTAAFGDERMRDVTPDLRLARETARQVSQRAAVNAIAGLDRVLGRDAGIDIPSHGRSR